MSGDSFDVGRYRLDRIAEFEGPRMPPKAMFTKADPAHLAQLLERVPPGSYDKTANMLQTSVHSWLVRDGAGFVGLIDTCFGNGKNRLPSHPFFHMQETDWLARLAALGVAPQDVTHVIITHLHLDHVGWNTRVVDGAWTPVFTRARHFMPRLEVGLARSGGMTPLEANDRALEDSVFPIIDAGLADYVEPDDRIAPDIRMVPCYGHSPGMLLVEISGGEPGVIAGGDPLHHPLQALDPDVNTGFCEIPDQSAKSRREFLARCADEGWTMAPTHFFVPKTAKVRRAGEAFEVVE